MAEEIAFENGRISNFEGLVTNMILAANFPSLQPGGSQEHISLITNGFLK